MCTMVAVEKFDKAFRECFAVLLAFMVRYPGAATQTCLFSVKNRIRHKITAPGTISHLAAKLKLQLILYTDT
jgi:hypothetical protein